MGRSLLTTPSAAMLDTADQADAFYYLAFNPGTGKILAYGRKAIFALARADLREPHEAIEILNAGVAGQNLWENQTPLPMARLVIDMLAEPWNWEQHNTAHKQRVS